MICVSNNIDNSTKTSNVIHNKRQSIYSVLTLKREPKYTFWENLKFLALLVRACVMQHIFTLFIGQPT